MAFAIPEQELETGHYALFNTSIKLACVFLPLTLHRSLALLSNVEEPPSHFITDNYKTFDLHLAPDDFTSAFISGYVPSQSVDSTLLHE